MSVSKRWIMIGVSLALASGAAYVPVDADDPDERAELVFSEANVVGMAAGMAATVRTRQNWTTSHML